MNKEEYKRNEQIFICGEAKFCPCFNEDTLNKWEKKVLKHLDEISDEDARIIFKKFKGERKGLAACEEVDDNGTQKFLINKKYPLREQDVSLIHEIIHDVPIKERQETPLLGSTLDDNLVECLARQLYSRGLADKIYKSKAFLKLL